MPLPETIYAQASPRSVGGQSLFDAGSAIDASVVDSFAATEEVTNSAADQLRAAGFEVLHEAPTTINIAGPPDLYQSVFNTSLVTDERRVIKGGAVEDTATFIDSADTNLQGLIDPSGSGLENVIEGVAIEEPVYYMANAMAPAAGYWHLRVPGDVSLGLRADPVHRAMAVTGRKVTLAMVDSGWYEHPYFTERGYRYNRVLGPAAQAIERDESGHGTGESANAFAVAPDIEFTMVKMSFVNSIGAFNKAVDLNPQIISCSWGQSLQRGPLSAANQALAAAVAAAVARGIIVVFSAGNGHWGFPGQHPDVISAGGVYVGQDGAMQASDYASGFASNIYPDRKCPDACGLVGMKPGASYIMLPVEPGDEIDRGRPGGTHPPNDETAPDDGWAAFSGTSAAAPQLAGVCALMREANPEITPAQARDALMSTARDVTAGVGAIGNAAGPGFDLATGAGLVDAGAAVRLAAGYMAGAFGIPTGFVAT